MIASSHGGQLQIETQLSDQVKTQFQCLAEVLSKHENENPPLQISETAKFAYKMS